MGKRYYWLKLKNDFFQSKEIKKLRTIAGGDTYTIIYLKMMLYSLDKDGLIEYEEFEDTLAEEIALAIDERPDNMDRLYINARDLGLECTYYKTGNISGAWFKGDEISHAEAGRMKWAKTYINVQTGKVVSDNDTLGRAAAELAGLTY